MMGSTKRSHLLAGFICSMLPGFLNCAGNRPDPELATTFVRVTQDSVALQRTPDMTSFSVKVKIRNDGRVPIVFGGCGPAAQRNISGVWTTVWTPICISSQTATIMPGDSVAFPVTVAGFTIPRVATTGSTHDCRDLSFQVRNCSYN